MRCRCGSAVPPGLTFRRVIPFAIAIGYRFFCYIQLD